MTQIIKNKFAYIEFNIVERLKKLFFNPVIYLLRLKEKLMKSIKEGFFSLLFPMRLTTIDFVVVIRHYFC